MKKKINDKVLVDLIMRMISLKENERPKNVVFLLFNYDIYLNGYDVYTKFYLSFDP